MDPIQLNSISGDQITNEISKVEDALNGLGDQAYTTFNTINTESSNTFTGMNAVIQQQINAFTELLSALKENELAQKQLNTSVLDGIIQANEYATAKSELALQEADLKTQLTQVLQLLDDEQKAVGETILKLADMRSELEKLSSQYAALTDEEKNSAEQGRILKERIGQLEGQIKEAVSSMKNTPGFFGELVSSMSSIPGPLGGATKQLSGFTKTASKLLSSGAGMAAAGIAAGFQLAKIAIEGSEGATRKMTYAITYLKSTWATFKQMVTETARMVTNFFRSGTSGAAKNAENIKRLAQEQHAAAKAAGEAAANQQLLNRQTNLHNDLMTLNKNAISKKTALLNDQNIPLEKQLELIKEINALEKQNHALETTNVHSSYENFTKEHQLSFNKMKAGDASGFAKLENAMGRLKTGEVFGEEESRELINTVYALMNNAGTGFDDGNRKAMAKYVTDALALNKTYSSSIIDEENHINQYRRRQRENTDLAIKRTQLEILESEMAERRQKYEMYDAYVRNMGEEAGRKAYESLLESGDNYIGYLNRKISELEDKADRTNEEDTMLSSLYMEKESAQTPFDPAPLQQELEEKRKFYKDNLQVYEEYLTDYLILAEQDQSAHGQEKLKILQQEQAGVEQQRALHLEQLCNQYQDFSMRMMSLEENYQRDKAVLTEAAGNAESEAERKRFEDILNQRTTVHSETLSQMLNENKEFATLLFGELGKASKQALQAAIAEAEKFLEEWKDKTDLSPDMEKMVKQTEEALKTAKEKLKTATDKPDNAAFKLPDEFGKSVNALKECANFANVFGGSLGDALTITADLAEGTMSMATGIGQIASGDILGGITNTLKGATKIIGTIKGRLDENKRIRKEYLALVEKTHDKELAYNAVLRERLRLQKQLGETTLQYSQRLQKELQKQQTDINKEYNEVYSKLMGEKYISDTKYKHGTLLRKASVKNVYSGLAGKSYEDIEQLYAKDKLTDSAKELFERLRQLKEEGTNVAEMMANLQEEMKQAWTGTTSSSITDSIVQGFLDGKRSAEDFADDFEEMMKKAMMQSIKLKYIEGPIMDWYDKFAEASEVGLTEERIEALRRQYNQILEDAAGHIENMELITGIGVGNALGDAVEDVAVNDNTLRGAYAKASQESIDLLAGQTGALRITVDNIHNSMVNLYSLQEQGWNEVVEIKQLVNTIEGHSKSTRESLDRMSTVGVKINMN